MPIIYFGDKPLTLQEEGNDTENSLTNDKEVLFLDSIEPERIKSLIEQMQQGHIKAGFVLHNTQEALGAIAKNFVVIQAAGGFIHDNQNKVLLIFRRGKWDLPKGKLDEGEDLAQCAVREVEEETGLLNVTLENKLCITYHTYFQDGAHILKESHWYCMQANSSQVLTPQLDEDIDECKWVKVEEIDPYMENTHPSVRDVVSKGIKVLNASDKV